LSKPDYTAGVTDTSTLSEEDEAATDDFLGSMADASLAGAGDAADFAAFFDFPSLNEVKELLPGVLKELAPPPPQPTIIPEPKLINREESRANLVSHVEHLHALVEDRLTGCETRLDQLLDNTSIGGDESLDMTGINRGLYRLLRDLRSIQSTNLLLPDKL